MRGPVRQKHTTIGIAGARPAAGVRHLDLEGQAAGDHEQMRVHRRRAVVGDPVDPSFLASPSLMSFSLAGAVSAGRSPSSSSSREPAAINAMFTRSVTSRNSSPCHAWTGHRRCPAAGRWPAGRRSAPQRREIRTVDRVEEVRRAQLEHPRRRVGIEVHERGIVEAVLDEVGEIVHLIVAQAQAARRARSARVGEPGRQRARGAGLCVLRHTGVEIPHHVLHARERAVVEEESGVLELPQRQHAELEGVAVADRDFPPAVIAEVGIVSRRAIQGLERVVGEPEVVEVLFHELTDAGHVGVVHLLVEHRTAVAGVATRAAAPSRT